MLPLSLLRTAIGHPLMVELKNGSTFNGYLQSIDNFMNLILTKTIHTSKDGDQFWKIPECYIRGNTIKYLCIPDNVIDLVQDEVAPVEQTAPSSRGRGGSERGRGGHRDQSGGSDRGSERGGHRGGRGSDRGGERGGHRGGRGGRGQKK